MAVVARAVAPGVSRVNPVTGALTAPSASLTPTGSIALPRDQPRDESGGFILTPSQQVSQAAAQQAALDYVARPMPPGALLTGSIAIPRDTPRDAGGQFILTPQQVAKKAAAVEAGADQRLALHGIDPGAREAVIDYYLQTGRYPDLSQGLTPDGVPQGLTEASMLGGSVAGIPVWVWMAGVLGVAALVLSRQKGRR